MSLGGYPPKYETDDPGEDSKLLCVKEQIVEPQKMGGYEPKSNHFTPCFYSLGGYEPKSAKISAHFERFSQFLGGYLPQ